MINADDLGRQLAAIRRTKGLTQAQIGRQATVSDIENGKDVLLSSFLAAAVALGLEIRLVPIQQEKVVSEKARMQTEGTDPARSESPVASRRKPAVRKLGARYVPKSVGNKAAGIPAGGHAKVVGLKKPVLDARKVKNSNLNAAVKRVADSRLGVLSEQARARLESAGAAISGERVGRIVDGAAPSHWLSVRSSKKKK